MKTNEPSQSEWKLILDLIKLWREAWEAGPCRANCDCSRCSAMAAAGDHVAATFASLEKKAKNAEASADCEYICGLCGGPGADKLAHLIHWPGEQVPDGPMVHSECEDAECRRAHALLTPEQRDRFLKQI